MVALQGPRTMDLAAEIAGPEIHDLKRYRLLVKQIGPIPILVSSEIA